MYFLLMYEIFPEMLFDEQNMLFTLVLPIIGVVVGLNFKKLKLKNFSLKNKSASNVSKQNVTNNETSEISESGEGNSEIEALLSGASEAKEGEGNSEIEALLSGASEAKEGEGNSEIEAMLAGTETPEVGLNQTSSEDVELIVMEKIEPIENDIQSIKTDFDQFKQDLTIVKEEVEGLSTSFETTLTDIKLLTTDANNPLNFMKEDGFKENIQKINVDELINKPKKSHRIFKCS